MMPVDANMSMGHPTEGSAAHNAHNAGSGLPSATVWKVIDFFLILTLHIFLLSSSRFD